jgi:hypothetical protein
VESFPLDGGEFGMLAGMGPDGVGGDSGGRRRGLGIGGAGE